MSKIKCYREDCKENKLSHCTKDSIKVNGLSCCESYCRGNECCSLNKEKNLNEEYAFLNEGVDTSFVECDALSCESNGEGVCILHKIIMAKRRDLAKCESYKRKNSI